MGPGIIAVGETGLDYHYPDGPTKDMQEKNFRAHIRVARDTGLPMLIHSRESDEDVIGILSDEMRRGPVKAVMHSFAGGASLRDFALECGFLVSASGMITFKNAGALRDSFASVPPERVIVETDAPFLAPAPYRGKENEPAFVVEVAAKLAELYGMAAKDIADVTTKNFKDYFGLA
jgi:TatD DNase family protein